MCGQMGRLMLPAPDVEITKPDVGQVLRLPSALSIRSSSCSNEVMIRAPVHPIGWPSAIAPPFTLSRSGLNESSLLQAITCAANASFSSIKSRINASNLVVQNPGPRLQAFGLYLESARARAIFSPASFHNPAMSLSPDSLVPVAAAVRSSG